MSTADRQPELQTQWIVMKFGGSSVSSGRGWTTIIEQARLRIAEGRHVLIVVSALSGVTDLLGQLAEQREEGKRKEMISQIRQRHADLLASLNIEMNGEFDQIWVAFLQRLEISRFPADPQTLAELLAFGELLSSTLGQQVLQTSGLPASLLDARTCLRADGPVHTPLSVRCGDDADPGLSGLLATAGTAHITQGFIVAGPDRQTCLLGRGGSDTSAACFAARLQAELLEIWTDVPGMFSADPRIVPDARLLRNLGYREAQELASMGAKVLHPPSIQPARRHNIPVYIRDTLRPELPGTCITAADREAQAQVKGVVSRKAVTLVNMENPAMWRQSGFLADAFAVFKQHGFSVDLISTSESTITVSLDPETAVDSDGSRFVAFISDLSALCRVEVLKDCVSISLVGNAIRTILGRLSSALDVFQDRRIHLVTQSANDLNFTLVVDAEYADGMVRKLHQTLIASQADSRLEFGPSWTDLNRSAENSRLPPAWWRTHAPGLLKLMGEKNCAYVYHLEAMQAAAARIQCLDAVDRVLYAVKANDHPEILRALAGEGLGFDCVSLAEVDHVLESIPGLAADCILFTPNFAPREEYEKGFERGVRVTVDNSWVLHQWPDVFEGRDIFLRLDLESGHGHHKKVITSGKDSKFGVALEHLDSLAEHLVRHGITVTGLHAHTGSGVSDARVWKEQLNRLLQLLPRFPSTRVLDLGGGLGVPDRPNQPGLNLSEMNAHLLEARAGLEIELWLEPGRFLVAEAGVLLARVTQLKDKGSYHYVGVATGMNSLIRPALYGAYHEIVNLSRLEETPRVHCRVVGPICESGDVLGESRLLPPTREGDVLLIATTGAYGRVMASYYNRRGPAQELFFTATAKS